MPKVLVSIHDVTPAHADSVKRLWELCRTNGFTPALLVVPDWHGEWPLHDHPEFVKWVLECGASGAELILHGYRHDEFGLGRSFGDSLRAIGRTNREGEFLTLNGSDARKRLQEGLEMLNGLSVHATGFIPPAWLCRTDTHDEVKRLGLLFSEDAGTIRLHSSNKIVATPVVRWSARSSWRAAMSDSIALIRRRTVRSEFLRLALHPQDLSHRIAESSVIREVRVWSQIAQQQRYDGL